ncbi:MAG: hypothetical protein IJ576_07290 [Synergistaceae bacterium]|nr:hypothetical protein [Synergistaceae bacterium]
MFKRLSFSFSKKLFTAVLIAVLACSCAACYAAPKIRPIRHPKPRHYNYSQETHSLFREFKDFKAYYNQHARHPHAAVRLYFYGVFAFTEAVRTGDKHWEREASKMIRYALHSDNPIENSPSLSELVRRLRDPGSAHIFRSFLTGTSPENNYTPKGGMGSIRDGSFRINFVNSRPQIERDDLKVLIKSSGADSPRTVYTSRYDDGRWYVTNPSSTYVQVARPHHDDYDNNRPRHHRRSHDADYD